MSDIVEIDLTEFKVYLKLIKKHRKMSLGNWLDLETLGSRLIMPENGHWRFR